MLSYVSAALVATTAYAASAEYSQNGANWGETTPLCKDGLEQSPIDLKDATVSNNIELIGFNYFNYNGSNSDALADNALRQGNMPSPQNESARLELTFDDLSMKTYTPLQFHFHAPSEHTVEGKYYDLEVHFVHKNQGATDTGIAESYGAVIGVFFDVQAGGAEENAFIASVLEALATGQEVNEADRKDIMVKEFFDSVDFSEYWSYPGSLTTPPCWEGIKWNVIKEVQSISPAQLAEFTKNWADNADFANGNGNNRVVMPINDRTLLMSNAAAPAANQQNNTDDGASAVTTFGAAVIAAVASLAF